MCYKFASKDYASSFGLARNIRREILTSEGEDWKTVSGDASKEIEALTYHLYLDDPMLMGGRRQRFATGIMGTKKEVSGRCGTMLETNGSSSFDDTTVDQGLSAKDYFKQLPFQKTDFPSVNSLVLQFPNTHGFVSALTLSYKVRFF